MRRLSPTTVIACLALFFAIAGGSAIALQGRNSVDSGDIKAKAVKTSDIANNAVTTKKIKNNHVRAGDIQDNAVGTGEIRNGQIAAADIGNQEAYQVVGQAGQPAFNNGVEGDCLWVNVVSPPIQLNPVSFYKDGFGRVKLAGAAQSVGGAGGDGMCGGAGAEANEDGFIFVLPEAYRPANDELRLNAAGGAGAILLVGNTPIVSGTGTLPAGAVYDLTSTDTVVLDGVEFRAMNTGSGLTRRGARGTGDLPASVAGLFD